MQYLLEATQFGASEKEISERDHAAIMTLSGAKGKAGVADNAYVNTYLEMREKVCTAALSSLYPLLHLEATPETYTGPFIKVLGNLFVEGDVSNVTVANKATQVVFVALTDSDVKNIVSTCLEMSYDSDPRVSAGYFDFLIRILKIKKESVQLSLPVVFGLIFFKLGHKLEIHRSQAIRMINVMSESKHLRRRYLTASNCLVLASFKRIQTQVSTEFAAEYKEHTMSLWREGFHRLKHVDLMHQIDVVRYMSPWLANMSLSNMSPVDREEVLENMMVITFKHMDMFEQDMEDMWNNLIHGESENLRVVISHVLSITTRDRSPEVVEVFQNACVFLAKNYGKEIVDVLIHSLSKVETSLEAEGGKAVADWSFAMKKQPTMAPAGTVKSGNAVKPTQDQVTIADIGTGRSRKFTVQAPSNTAAHARQPPKLNIPLSARGPPPGGKGNKSPRTVVSARGAKKGKNRVILTFTQSRHLSLSM